MPTNRELLFKYKNQNKYLTESVIKLLLMFVNGFSSETDYVLNIDKEVKNIDEFSRLILELKDGCPIQYVTHTSYFLNESYYVNHHVLIPRQETEQLVIESVKLIKDVFEKQNITICDMCTGSGIIGINMKKSFPDSATYVTDIDSRALQVAKRNIDNKKVDVELLKGDMVEPIINKDIKIDALICNPPYIPSKDTIDEATYRFEPHLALLASPDTFFYEVIFKNYQRIMNKKFVICFEIGEDMEKSLTELIKKYFKNIEYKFSVDLYNKTRFLYIVSRG